MYCTRILTGMTLTFFTEVRKTMNEINLSESLEVKKTFLLSCLTDSIHLTSILKFIKYTAEKCNRRFLDTGTFTSKTLPLYMMKL